MIGPHLVTEDEVMARLQFGDGEADLYLDDDGIMANHVSGQDPWDLLVTGARAAGWVNMPVGCPTCITDEAQRRHLPEGMDDDVVHVSTGADLLRVVTTA